jgi:hypothetical protein
VSSYKGVEHAETEAENFEGEEKKKNIRVERLIMLVTFPRNNLVLIL